MCVCVIERVCVCVCVFVIGHVGLCDCEVFLIYEQKIKCSGSVDGFHYQVALW